ncbi:MAG: DNA-binding protein WhiA [Clostridia bacterium]|nr:DNA-binding protein WhiA [Clostridia bacterium]
MDSISKKIKAEILRNIPRNIPVSERQAVIAGIFCSAAKANATAPELSVRIEEEIAEGIRKLLNAENIGSSYSDDKLKINESGEISGSEFKEFYRICFNGAAVDALSSDISFGRCFLKGVFVSCGYFSDPQKKYSVELHVRNRRITNLVVMMMRMQQIDPLIMEREHTDVVYLTDGDKISDFLSIIGSSSGLLDFENVRVQHEMNALVNRQTNCDLGNTKRQAEAGVKRRELFRKLEESEEYAKLTPELKNVVKLHNDNPGLSISQLGAMMDPPISKSGMNHRLQKIMEIANNL